MNQRYSQFLERTATGLLLFVAACSSRSVEEPKQTAPIQHRIVNAGQADGGQEESKRTPAKHAIANSGEIPGYLFDGGQINWGSGTTTTRTATGYLRTEGSDLAFAVLSNRWLATVSPTKAYMLSMKPYGSTAVEHHAMVRQYFIDHGLPEDQIADVQGGADAADVVKVEDALAGKHAPLKLLNFWSIITRKVEGIRVPYSRIVVSFAADGTPFSLFSDWPPIPKAAVAAAKALPAIVTHDADESVPEPVILHSGGYEDDSVFLAPTAVYQSMRGDGRIVYRDLNQRVFLPPFASERRFGPRDGSTTP